MHSNFVTNEANVVYFNLGEVLRAAGFDTHSGEKAAGENLKYFLNNIKGEEWVRFNYLVGIIWLLIFKVLSYKIAKEVTMFWSDFLRIL